MADFREDLEVYAMTKEEPSNGKLNFKIHYSKDFEETDISDLQVSARATNVLKRGNIRSIGELLDNWDRLQYIKGCGNKVAREVKQKFLTYYYKHEARDKKKFWREVV